MLIVKAHGLDDLKECRDNYKDSYKQYKNTLTDKHPSLSKAKEYFIACEVLSYFTTIGLNPSHSSTDNSPGRVMFYFTYVDDMKKAISHVKKNPLSGFKTIIHPDARLIEYRIDDTHLSKSIINTSDPTLNAIHSGDIKTMETIAKKYFYGTDGFKKSHLRAKYWIERAKSTATTTQEVNRINQLDAQLKTEADQLYAKAQKYFNEVLLPLQKEQEERDRIYREQQIALEQAEQEYQNALEQQRKERRRREADADAEADAQMWRDVVSGIQHHGQSIRNDMTRNNQNAQSAYRTDRRNQEKREAEAREAYEKKRREILAQTQANQNHIDKQKSTNNNSTTESPWDCDNRWRPEKCGDRVVNYEINRLQPAYYHPNAKKDNGAKKSSNLNHSNSDSESFQENTSPNDSSSTSPNNANLSKINGKKLLLQPVAGGWTGILQSNNQKTISMWHPINGFSGIVSGLTCIELSGSSHLRVLVKNTYTSKARIGFEIKIYSEEGQSELNEMIHFISPGQEMELKSYYLNKKFCELTYTASIRITSLAFEKDRYNYSNVE